MDIVNEKKKYLQEGNSLYSCQYIVSFHTKYKRKVLDANKQKFLKNELLKIAKEFDFRLSNIEITNNQVTMKIDCNPKFGVYTAITKLKNNSAVALKKEYPELEKRIPSIWTRDTFISSIGVVDYQDINKFSELQKKYETQKANIN